MSSTAGRQLGFDEASYVARSVEDVVVGHEIIRHRLSSRVIHWAVATTFFFCVLTGLPIWTPLFGWLGLSGQASRVCRVLHPFFGSLLRRSRRRPCSCTGRPRWR